MNLKICLVEFGYILLVFGVLVVNYLYYCEGEGLFVIVG